MYAVSVPTNDRLRQRNDITSKGTHFVDFSTLQFASLVQFLTRQVVSQKMRTTDCKSRTFCENIIL